ncbi:potassium ABC transporter ATPase [Duganella sp. sic0402]|nr:potassium ABC transporter ATPase [Duganella sp. sic0402]MBV7537311.1 potassium ABC transporter ATPase [Duganella sp. sic0402]
MDLVFIGATALLYLLTVALAAGCSKLGEQGGQP